MTFLTRIRVEEKTMRSVKKAMLFLALIAVCGCFNLNVKVPSVALENTGESAAPGPAKPRERVVVNAPGVHVDVGVGAGRASAKKIQASRWFNSGAIELKKLRGRYVVLHFFVANEERSRKEIADLVRQARLWPADKVVVIGIHPMRQERQLEKLLGRDNVTYPVALDDKDKTVKDYKIVDFPSTVLIDPDGRVVLWAENLEAVKVRLNKLLAEK